jgi:hypothetical protein
MKINTLELAVIERTVAANQQYATSPIENLADLAVIERNVDPVGFLTEIDPSGPGCVFRQDFTMRWGGTNGRLNGSIDVAFVVYIDAGCITGIEGATYGGELWPTELESFELADLK